MFDIGFPELLLVSIVALLVIGPDRLPETVRSIMVWLGKMKQSFANIKTDIEQEIGIDEIRQEIHNNNIMKDLESSKHEIQNMVQDTIRDTQIKLEDATLADTTSTPNVEQKSDPSTES